MSEKEAKTLNWGIEFFDRVVVGLTVSTELFWIDDRNTRGPLGAIRHYCLLHIGHTEIENGDYWAFEIIIPFAHLAIAILHNKDKESTWARIRQTFTEFFDEIRGKSE